MSYVLYLQFKILPVYTGKFLSSLKLPRQKNRKRHYQPTRVQRQRQVTLNTTILITIILLYCFQSLEQRVDDTCLRIPVGGFATGTWVAWWYGDIQTIPCALIFLQILPESSGKLGREKGIFLFSILIRLLQELISMLAY